MTYNEVLFHPTLIMATILYAFITISFEVVYQAFLHKVAHVSSTHWIAKHIGLPFFHVLILVGFIYMTYPTLYGIDVGNVNSEQTQFPSLTDLLNAKSGQTMKLINTLFVISVILPLLPIINRFMGLILPLQAIAGSAVLYSWLALYQQVEPSLWPGFDIALIIIALSIAAEYAAKGLAGAFGYSFNQRYHTHDMEKVIHKSALLIFQIPILLVYTLNLPIPLTGPQ